jgi:Kip1 ubiquitination-promoting complex protein 1
MNYGIFQQVTDLQQRKCSIMFELSCNLERVLEFFTRELPEAFLCGPEMNLVRLCELMMFVLNHTASIDDAMFFERQVENHIFNQAFNNNMLNND